MSATTDSTVPETSGPQRPHLPLIAIGIGFLVALVLLPVQVHHAFGLPAHPLLLHVPVILVPALALAAIAIAGRPAWRRRCGLAVAALGVVTMAATILTVGAGEAWRDDREAHTGGFPGFDGGRRGETAQLAHHASLGETLRLMVIALALVIILFVGLDHVTSLRRFASNRGLSIVLAGVVAVLSVVSAVWVVRTGHAGAKLAWDQPSGPPGGQRPSGGQFPSGGQPSAGGAQPPAGAGQPPSP